MLSAFFRPIDLYVGRGVLLAQPHGGALEEIPFTKTDDLAVALADWSSTNGAHRAYRVFLSGWLAPAVSFDVPPPVRGQAEIGAIAAATAEAAMPPDLRPVACALERGGARIAAPAPSATLDALRAAVRKRGGRIDAIAPLWSAATRCQLLRSAKVAAMLLEEPDSCTLAATPPRGEAAAVTLPRMEDGSLDGVAIRRWQTAVDLPAEQWLHLRFGGRSAPLAGAPSCFASYWSRA